MRRLASILAVASLAIAFAPRADAQRAPKGPSVAECIRSWGEARYGAIGYNHIVHIADGCDAPAECTVSTDVNPEPQTVVVPGHQTIETTTFLGSPARTFVPKVVCVMRPPAQ